MLLVLIKITIFLNFGLAQDFKDFNPLELVKLGQDVLQVVPSEVLPSDVQFYLSTQSAPEPVLITPDNKHSVDPKIMTKIIIHGWLENYKRSWYKSVADQYLEKDNFNFVEVNWVRPARMPYIYSAKSVRLIGTEVAQFIEDTMLFPKDIHIIGHSLGAHVAGFAGKKVFEKTGQKLQRITGLDPAGPLFRYSNIIPSERLDKGDANIVDAIHTDAGFYGYESPIGTLDIYVNGGQRIQPGCLGEWMIPTSLGDVLEKSFCSHARSTKYFTEWINKGKFKCKFCQSVFGINLYGDRCTYHTDALLGSDDVTANVTGVCFAKTNKEEPYLE